MKRAAKEETDERGRGGGYLLKLRLSLEWGGKVKFVFVCAEFEG
jgi:hypothetical protein